MKSLLIASLALFTIVVLSGSFLATASPVVIKFCDHVNPNTMTCNWNCSTYLFENKPGSCFPLPGHADAFSFDCSSPGYSKCVWGGLWTHPNPNTTMPSCGFGERHYSVEAPCDVCYNGNRRFKCGADNVDIFEFSENECKGTMTHVGSASVGQCAKISSWQEDFKPMGYRPCHTIDAMDYVEGNGRCHGPSKSLSGIGNGECVQYGEHNEISFTCIHDSNGDGRLPPPLPARLFGQVADAIAKLKRAEHSMAKRFLN